MLRIFLVFACSLILTEIILRYVIDLGEKALYIEDSNCEYRMAPNQDFSRFHNHFSTNSYGMRSPEISENDKVRILLFGDSVLNGGSDVDQNDLINYILSDRLSQEYGYNVDACNISAGSWGVENAYQYLLTQVDFEFDMIILIFSSHDYHDNMHFRKVVGIEPAWPDKQPLTAIGDLFENGVMPRVRSWFNSNYDYLQGFDDSKVNPGWQHFINYSDSVGIPMIVYHHPEISELDNKHFNENGQNINEIFDSTDVYYINGIECSNSSSYVDNIHQNGTGHKRIGECLAELIINRKLLPEKN